ncbi:MAG: hypothetical protein JEZ02_04020 [Desulfatibacillum sp.]|nr:hypothetical protein [Desulfatibacillum sp.]
MRWITFLSKRHEPLKSYEKKILLPIGDQLTSEKQTEFINQMEAIHSVVRSNSKKEVVFRYKVQDKDRLRAASPFFNRWPERVCASVQFQVAELNELFHAEIGLVNGVVFSIELNKSPKKIGKKPILIQETRIFPESMWPDGNQAPPKALSGPVGEWTDKHGFSRFHPPLSAKAIEAWLQYFDISFPTEYLDIINQTEGAESDNFIIHGLSSLPRVVFPKENYLILCEIKGCGVLTIGRSGEDNRIQFFHFEDDGPYPQKGSFWEVMESQLKECCEQNPWLREGYVPSSRDLS